ncbi:MAG: nuclear transport factor 2 family protein [Pseudomonadota bacterium]
MRSILLVIGMVLCASAAHAQDAFSADRLEQMAMAFIDAKNARQQPDSKTDDVDAFLALLSDDFVDEHIRFGVTVTDKNELRRGMLRKLEDEVFFSAIEVQQLMIGRNVVFVKYTETARVKPTHLDNVIEYSSISIVSLEFDDNGLITHIRRHHG